MNARRGFTLLEVMIALSILALSLTVVAGINANSFQSSNYARGLTVATLLARSKMLDVELKLQEDGFAQGDSEEDGDFSDEGHPSVDWTVYVRPIDVDVTQLVRQFFGGGEELDLDTLPDQMQAFMGAKEGLDPSRLASEGGSAPADEIKQLLGGQGLELVLQQVSETLKNSIREIVLDVSWGPEKARETVRFVQYVTTTGRIAPPTGRSGLRGPGNILPPTNPDGTDNEANQPLQSPFQGVTN
ncbi:MAG: prepilin-type N-terminal cleavage/methylation domain-containing protein [Myxococcota bacterium]